MFKFLMKLPVEFNKVPVCWTILCRGGGSRDKGTSFYIGSALGLFSELISSDSHDVTFSNGDMFTKEYTASPLKRNFQLGEHYKS